MTCTHTHTVACDWFDCAVMVLRDRFQCFTTIRPHPVELVGVECFPISNQTPLNESCQRECAGTSSHTIWILHQLNFRLYCTLLRLARLSMWYIKHYGNLFWRSFTHTFRCDVNESCRASSPVHTLPFRHTHTHTHELELMWTNLPHQFFKTTPIHTNRRYL